MVNSDIKYMQLVVNSPKHAKTTGAVLNIQKLITLTQCQDLLAIQLNLWSACIDLGYGAHSE